MMPDINSIDASSSPAAPQEPTHTYIAHEGYRHPEPSETTSPQTQSDAKSSSNLKSDEIYNNNLDDDEDSEEYDNDIDGLDWHISTGNLTKSYNRQRVLLDSNPHVTAPRQNPQNPAVDATAEFEEHNPRFSKLDAKIQIDAGGAGGKEQSRKKDKSDRATVEQVLDNKTLLLLRKIMDSGDLTGMNGCISTGKEAHVYEGFLTPQATEENPDPKTVRRAVKIYATRILVFKDRAQYVEGEHRFKSGYRKSNNKEKVKLWAEKEMRNLRRLHSAGVPCPEPLRVKGNVLVMGYLADKKGQRAPQLRHVHLPGSEVEVAERWTALYRQLLFLMQKMYQVCKLVHGDLSEYNILYHEDKLFIIDVSQSTEPDNPESITFLKRDIKTCTDFFSRKGVYVLSERNVFDLITKPGSSEEAKIQGRIDELYKEETSAVNQMNTEEAAAKKEVDNEVFRHQFIPRTLDEVHNIERDVAQINEGGGNDLVYKNLLPSKVVRGKETQPISNLAAEASDEDNDSARDGHGADSVEDEDDTDDESRFKKGAPRGKRFQDKESKKEHKEAVKLENREKRSEKMPKHVKKRLISLSSRTKK